MLKKNEWKFNVGIRQMQPKLDSIHIDRVEFGSKMPISKDCTSPALLGKPVKVPKSLLKVGRLR